MPVKQGASEARQGYDVDRCIYMYNMKTRCILVLPRATMLCTYRLGFY
jgi:hypothetical protein